MNPDSALMLSPLDGRYIEATAPLRDYFSEYAYLRNRLRVEIDFLQALSGAGIVRPLQPIEADLLKGIWANFNPAKAETIRALERQTRHDVKAIEYYLRQELEGTSLSDLLSWLHFGLTSEDVNNIAQAIALRDSRDAILLPALDNLLSLLLEFVKQYRALPMLARTHGQPAVPTTLGREFAVFLARLKKIRDQIGAHRFEAKLTGAVGNLNAMSAALPQMDWLSFSRQFIQAYDLDACLLTTQILPLDNWISYFDALRLLNTILIDFSQDVWRYISDEILKQAVIAGEVGSSTMPQKINPIDFENAEGNLGLANALFVFYAQKLGISRLQRDLSDSTVRRTFGVALGHTLLAWNHLSQGMKRIRPDERKIQADLNAHWEVIAEGAQTILRTVGRADAYETLKSHTRGHTQQEADYKAWLASLDVSGETLLRLQALTPGTYLGYALELCDKVIQQFENLTPPGGSSNADQRH